MDKPKKLHIYDDGRITESSGDFTIQNNKATLVEVVDVEGKSRKDIDKIKKEKKDKYKV